MRIVASRVSALVLALLVSVAVTGELAVADHDGDKPVSTDPPVLSPVEEYEASVDGYVDELVLLASSHSNYTNAELDQDSRTLTLYGTGEAS